MWKLRWRGQLSEAWKSQCNCHPGASNAGGHRSCALLAISSASVYPSRYAHAARLRCRINMRSGISRLSGRARHHRRRYQNIEIDPTACRVLSDDTGRERFLGGFRRPVREEPRACFHEFTGIVGKMLGTQHHIKRLPVIQDDKLVGIIGRADLVRAFAQSAEKPAPAPVRDVSVDSRLAELERQIWRNRARVVRPF